MPKARSSETTFDVPAFESKARAKSPEIGKAIDDAMGDVAQASSPAGSGGVLAASRNTGRGRPANPQPGTAALRSKDAIERVLRHSPFKLYPCRR
jgi:hypothetical protein